MLLQHVGGLLRADAGRARDLVRRIAAERDEVRHLLGLDAVALAHLRRADARELRDALDRLQDRHPVGHELERVAIRCDDGHRPRPRPCAGGEEVVGLVPRCLADEESERLRQPRQPSELLEDRGLELAPRLVGGERLVPVRRRLERVPADEHRLRLLGVPEPHEEAREADEGVGRPAVSLDRLRDRVVGAMGERVAVDGQQGAAHSDSSSAPIASISRSVAIRAASPVSTPARSSSCTGGP